jgi:hypothetical protein
MDLCKWHTEEYRGGRASSHPSMSVLHLSENTRQTCTWTSMHQFQTLGRLALRVPWNIWSCTVADM